MGSKHAYDFDQFFVEYCMVTVTSHRSSVDFNAYSLAHVFITNFEHVLRTC